jgi:hypothetical protein
LSSDRFRRELSRTLLVPVQPFSVRWIWQRLKKKEKKFVDDFQFGRCQVTFYRNHYPSEIILEVSFSQLSGICNAALMIVEFAIQ